MRKRTRLLTTPQALIAIWIFGYFIALPLWQRWQPGTNWLEVTSIVIADVAPGDDPSMTVVRRLNLDVPTRGIWTAKLFEEGTNLPVCSNSHAQLYTPGAQIPVPQTLKLFHWWMDAFRAGGPERICRLWPLPQGRYCLETGWEFFPENYPGSKQVVAPIACFSVRAPEG